MTGMQMTIGVEGLDEIRALTAALEQYNAGSRGDAATWAAELAKAHDRIHQLEKTHDQQVAALTAARNNVDSLQRDLARTQGDTSQAVQMLQGKRSATLTTNEVGAMLLREVSAVMRALEANSVTIRNLQGDHLVKNVGAERLRERLTEANDELAYAYNIIKNRNMRLPDSSYKTDLLNEIADLVDRDVRREIGVDLAWMKQQLFTANDEITKQAREIDSLRADLRKEQKIKDFVNDECQKIRAALGLGRMAQAPEVLAAIEDLRSDSRMLEGTASALRGRLQESERVAEARAEVIKELHAQHHELEARKQGVQYDLDRAKEEIEFAEAEIAKYTPLIEAVRGGLVYGYWGNWVPINSVTVADMNDGTAVSFHIPNSEDPQCL